MGQDTSMNPAAKILLELKDHVAGIELAGDHSSAKARPGAPRWRLAELRGRLIELSGFRTGAALTMAFAMILDAQRQGETTAWVGVSESSFYPPDAEENGVDLRALPVVRCPRIQAVPRAADKLALSGAFGLIVMDLGSSGEIPAPILSRLSSLAKKHDCAILCLTRKAPGAASLGSLVSFRAEARHVFQKNGRIECVLRVIKDKIRGPGWGCRETYCGPPGLR